MSSTAHSPVVSFALPVYNGERYLAEAIDSILAQTFTDFELIICDNASTDRTERISREYAARDPRIRYNRNSTNIGVSRNFNLGLSLARGVYIKWAAYDDLMTPDYLGKCVALLEADPTLAVAQSHSARIDADGGPMGLYEQELKLDSPRAPERFESMLWAVAFPPIWGVMRASLVRRTGLFGAYVGSDRNFLAELLLLGGLAYVHECLFYIRIHPGAYLMQGEQSHAVRQRWYGAGRRYPSFMQLPVTASGYASALLRTRLPAEEQLACWASWAGWTGHCIKKLVTRRMSWLKVSRHRKQSAAATAAPDRTHAAHPQTVSSALRLHV